MKTNLTLYKSNPAGTLITASLILIGIVGLFSIYDYNILPAGAIFELVLLITAITVISKCNKKSIAFCIVAFFYVSVCGFNAVVLKKIHILDFLQAFKAYIYIIPLAFFVNKQIFTKKSLISLFNILLFLFLAKYVYSRTLEFSPRMSDRPGLYEENNFELIFLILLYYLISDSLKNKFLVFSILFFIVFISGSRSAFLGILIVYLFTFIRKVDFYFITSSIIIPIILMIGIFLFISRMDGGYENIDRFKFLMVFMTETENWKLFDFILGSPSLTALSNNSCQLLSFYEKLFSFSGDGSCYSVILHSYFLRVIFDHGVLGLIFLLVFIWSSLKTSGYKNRDIFCVYGVLLSSALSVSSLNSIFSALILAIFFSTEQKKHEN